MDKKEKIILVSNCKNEEYTLDTDDIRTLTSRLKTHFDFTLESYEEKKIILSEIKHASIFIIMGPSLDFSNDEMVALDKYVHEEGGNLWVQFGEKNKSNLSKLLYKYGIQVNNDNVIRTVFYKYFHPKEVCIENGVVNRAINFSAGKYPTGTQISGKTQKRTILKTMKKDDKRINDLSIGNSLVFVYPYGCSLTVVKPAIPVLSSGHVAYPINRPVGAVYESPKAKVGGRVLVLGSIKMFNNKYINKEENAVLQEILVRWLMRDETVSLNQIDANQPEISDNFYLPDSKMLGRKIKPCLEERKELPTDFRVLFETNLFSFDTKLIPKVIDLYKKLNMKHEPLSLIPPAFETPLPPLNPAVYPPILNEMTPPSLDLYDLDEEFASEEIRLAQCTNNCTVNDLNYYIQRCGDILQITSKLKKQYRRESKRILEFVFRQITHFKKKNFGEDQVGMVNQKGEETG